MRLKTVNYILATHNFMTLALMQKIILLNYITIES